MSKLTRRHFFQGAATALAATRVAGANDRIRIGIVGLGGRGNSQLGSFSRITECQVVALCDVNQAARERAQARLQKLTSLKAKEYNDMRDLFADKDVDAVSIATPNHWHALATIWACEAGKDVYVEKPASHNLYEGWRMVEVARRTQRMVQVGSQSRSHPVKIKAMKLLQEGIIGKVYMAKGLCFKRRPSIGKTPPEPVPPGLDWDKFLGPAPMRPYTKNRFAYNWHWFWDTGNGDIGNQGVHEMDICRWGLGEVGMPVSAVSTGGKYVYDDDQETPNTQLATFDYGDKQIVFEVRGLLTGPEAGLPVRPGNTIGNLFFGSDGWMWVDDSGFQVYKGEANQLVMEEKAERGDATVAHMRNFLSACRSRNYKELTAEIEIGAMSAALCHLANISYRVGRLLRWDEKRKKFVNDPEADKLITREYRKPYVV
ncbi:MAG: Gfo/Idh/MocA family oxidoreductase [Bryobacterales bacterium]|nr:Gfo/Idh/MocA family oxidoreductase [Bryobacteraceae bacterium]MDW8354605.1 Gfo/Idh/MocA family oxidoreductase [Bryobacterales bacterium]